MSFGAIPPWTIGFPRKVAPGRPCQSSLSYGCPIKLVSFCYRLASGVGLAEEFWGRRQPSGDSDPKDSPSPESFLVISFVLCGRRGADRTTHALQKTQALDRWSPRATEAQWYSIDRIWHISFIGGSVSSSLGRQGFIESRTALLALCLRGQTKRYVVVYVVVNLFLSHRF